MSGPLNLGAADLTNLADALASLTETTRRTGVDFTGYGDFQICIGDNYLFVALRDGAYVIDDQVGR